MPGTHREVSEFGFDFRADVLYFRITDYCCHTIQTNLLNILHACEMVFDSVKWTDFDCRVPISFSYSVILIWQDRLGLL